MSLKYLAAAPLILLATPAIAQDDAEEDRTASDADTIIVTGRGLPDTPATPAYSVKVLDREELTSAASGRIEDALMSVAGFQQFRRSDSRSSNPSAQGATLRALGGNASSRAQVLLDGVPMTDPFFGYIPFSALVPERLELVRVTRGGGSGPFGAGSLAGTIELESADAETLGPVQASLLANDRWETEASLSVAPRIGDGFAVVSGRWDRGQGFYTTPEDQRVPASTRAEFDAWSVSGRLVQRVAEDVELQVRGLAFDDRRVLRFEGADNSSKGEDVSLRLVGRGDWAFDLVAYAQWRNFTNVVISSTQFVPVLDQKDTPSSGLGGKLEIRPPVGPDHVLRIGADYRRSEGDLFEDAYSAFSGLLTEERFAGGVNSDLGLFIEDDWTIGSLILTGGLRADRWTIRDGYYRAFNGSGAVVRDDTYSDRSGWDLSWRAGAVLQASEALRLRAAAYRGLRQPTLNELYRPFVVFPVVTEANEDLENEFLTGFEAGLDLIAARGVTFSLTAFDNRVENAIANVTLAPNLRQRQNLDAIDAQGLELSAAVDRGEVSFNASIAYTDAKVDASGVQAPLDGNRPSQTPDWSASATLSWRPAEGMLLAATLRHVADQFEGDQENDVLPAATTLDLFAQVALLDRLSFVARAENLFDEEIVTRNQGGSIDLGAPRTVWAGLRYGF
jgi:outer membrane receptor protein involved in Fe transport